MYSNVIHKFIIEASVGNEETAEITPYTEAVQSVAIKKNYVTQSFPLYVVTLLLTETQRKYIVQNDVYLILKIYRYTYDENTTNTDVEASATEPTTDKVVTTIMLKPFDKVKIVATPNTGEVDENQNDETSIIESKKSSYTLNCIPKDKLMYNDTIINTVSSLYTGPISYQESENVTRYDSILIPPTSLIPALKFLQKNYQIYNNQITVFFDENKLFIYDIYNMSRQMTKSFSVNITPKTNVSDKTIYDHVQADENDNIQIYLPSNPMYVSKYNTYRHSTGGQTIFNTYDDNFNLISRSYSNDESVAKTRYYWNNDRLAMFEKTDLTKVFGFISLKLNNIDPSIIDPDTNFSIAGSELPELNNNQLILLGQEIYFSSTDYKNYNDSIIITLGKNK